MIKSVFNSDSILKMMWQVAFLTEDEGVSCHLHCSEAIALCCLADIAIFLINYDNTVCAFFTVWQVKMNLSKEENS